MFDIDHLYLWSYNYSVDLNGNVSLNSDSEKKNLLNALLTSMLTLINSVENSMHFLYKTVDTDTELLRNVSDKLQGATSYKHHAFNFGTLHEQIDRKNDYITGKIGIGPYALNVTNQELTRLSGVKFAETTVTKTTRISRLDNMVDVDDNPIASWESGYINGHVDIVKDPFVTALNINLFTYNLSNLLTRCGFSETTLWFLCQPIIKKMAAASNGANGQYTRDGSRGTYSIKEAAIAKACVEVTGRDETALADLLDRIKNPNNKNDYNYIAKCINYIEENAGLLLKVAIETDKNPNIEEVTYAKDGGVESKYNVKDVLLQVLKAYTALDKYQRSLGKLVQYTKIDTKNYGKSLIQTRRYLKIYNDLVHPDERDKSIFDMDSIDRLINNTWIEYKTKNAIMLPFLILGGLVFNANDEFVDQVLDFADLLNTGEDITEDMVNEISKSVITAIKSKYIIEYARTFKDGQLIKPKTDADIAKLFTSQNSLSKRLNRLLDQIRNNPNYKRLAGNYLLQSITAEFEEDPIIVDGKFAQRPSFISISSNVGDNKHNSDMFSEAWEDLLNDDDAFVRNFANDLIIYAFLTSGEYNGWTHMFKYVPYSWRVGKTRGFDHSVETFADFIKRMLAGGLTEIVNRDILDDVVANNFMNNSIIRNSRIVDQDGTVNFATNQKGNIAIGKWIEDIAEAPSYITLKKPGTRGKNQNDYRVYKLAAFYKNHPVYAEIVKRGYHHKGYDVYEYGWSFNYIENKSTNSMLFEDEINEAVRKIELFGNAPVGNDLNRLISIVSSEVNKVVNERRDNDNADTNQQEGPKAQTVIDQLIEHLKALGITVHNKQELDEYIQNNGIESVLAFIGKKARLAFKHQLMYGKRSGGVKPQFIYFVNDVLARPVEDWDGDIDGYTVTLRHDSKENIDKWVKDGLLDSVDYTIPTYPVGRISKKGLEKSEKVYMTEQEADEVLDFLHSLEDNKENAAYIKTAIRWIINRSITLPADHEKAKQAFDEARKRRVDISKYNTLGELIVSEEMKPKARKKTNFDPDKATTFSNKRIVTTPSGRIFTVYDVENTEEGQREVCKALAAWYEISPWCLSTFTSTGEPTRSAKHFWNVYNGVKRRIAYENGRPVAFSSDGGGIGARHWLEIDGKEIPVGIRHLNNLGLNMSDGVGKRQFNLESLKYFIDNGFIERNPEYDWVIDDDAYKLTDKGLNAIQERSSETKLEDREAWWDLNDIRPVPQLGDGIVNYNIKLFDKRLSNLLNNDNDPFDIEAPEFDDLPFIDPAMDDPAYFFEDEETPYDAFLNDPIAWRDLDDQEIAAQEYFESQYFITPSGEVYGFVTRDGQIYLDETVITPEHPLHEYTHIWDRIVAKKNPELWNRGIQLMKQTEMWKTIANSSQYGLKWAKIQNITQLLLDSMIASEVHARFVGEGGGALINKIAKEQGDSNIVEKLKKWILDFWKELRNTFGKWSKQDLDSLTLKDFNHMTVRDFVNGTTMDSYREQQIQKRLTGGMKYRPVYNFGRVYLTDNDRKHVREKITITDYAGNKVSVDGSQIDSVLKKIRTILDFNEKTEYVTIPYRQWKLFIQLKNKLIDDNTVDQFEYFVEHFVDYEFIHTFGIDTNKHGQYNKKTKEITLDKDFYDFVKVLHDNMNVLEFLFAALDDSQSVMDVLLDERILDVYSMFEMFDEDDGINYRIQYSYSDDRQQELFSNEDFELSEDEQREALDYKKACEGE